MPLIKSPPKLKITCLGCNEPYPSKIYSDGSYQHFYQDLQTQQFFCSDCISNEPIEEPIHHLLFRNKKYFNHEDQEACAQCKVAGSALIREWNDKDYCLDCCEWNEEAAESGIGNTCVRFLATYCDNCGECSSCLRRKGLIGYSTRDLIIELINRPDYQALLSWEDDSFQQRIQELAWELTQIEGISLQQIRKLVNEDIRKPLSERKYSRGT